MANGNDGSVRISTELDNDGLKKGIQGVSGQLGGLKSALKGIGTAVVAAFSVRAIAGFAKECIGLGSAVAEVQNVVDVAFGSMRGKMEAFAKDSITSFGMSELAAKQTGSTYMAMAKGMGVAEDAASDMAIALTGLSGDVASFFNIDQEEAANKLKSVFTGETETLKSLGVVMTEANLKQYALAHGMNANIGAMSQAERVALNYSFVMDSLSLAQGDFVRTQGSWANQTRILSMQWQQLMAVIGQGLTTVLLPVVKTLNSIAAAMLRVANAISAAFSQLFGSARKEFSAASSGAGAVADAYGGIGDSASDAAKGEEDLAKKTKSAADAAKKSLASFDEITQLQDQNAAASSGGTGGGAGGGAGGTGLLEQEIDTSEADGAASRLMQIMESLRQACETLRQTFMAGFTLGWGDSGKSMENIKADLASIGQSLRDIFTDPAVLGAADNFVLQSTFALGQLTGAAASIAVSVAENLVGGIAQWLTTNTDSIKNAFVNIFDAASLSSGLIGDLGPAFAEIYRALGSDSAISFTGGLIGAIGNALLGGMQTIAQILTLVLTPIFQPIIENADKLREAYTNVFSILSPIINTISTDIAWLFEQLNNLYNTVLLPLAEFLGGLFSDALGIILDAFNNAAPILVLVAEKYEALAGKVRELCEAIAERLQPVWETIMEWLENVFRPLWDSVFSTAGAVIQTFVAVVGAVLSRAMDLLGGIIDFLPSVFSGDWSGAWEAVKNAVITIWNTIKTGIGSILSGIGSVVSSVWNGITTAVTGAVQTVWLVVKSVWDTIYTNVSRVLTNLASVFGSIWNGIVNTVIGAVQTITGWIGSVIDAVSSAIAAVSGFLSGAGGGGSSGNKGIKKIAARAYVGSLSDFAGIAPELHVPALARGAVLPANQPFLSIVGDQPSGTNVETPLSTIEEAVANVMDGPIDAMMAGFQAVVNAIREKENTIYLSDETVSRAVTRHQNRTRFISGGDF